MRRIPRHVFNVVYKRLPQLRSALIEHGNMGETHFEISDEALARIGSIPATAKPRATAAAPAPCSGALPTPKPIREPTMAEMASNFAEATVEWSKSGFPVAQKDIALERAATCQSCPGGHWDAKARLGLGKCRHPRCGCSKLKWFLGTSKCPIGAWKH